MSENNEMETERTENLELTWDFEALVFKSKTVDGPDGGKIKQTIQVKELIHVPRLTTRRMLGYRRALMARYRDLLADKKKDVDLGNIGNVGIDPEELGEILIDFLMPGLLDRMVPASFKQFVAEVMIVEADVINPQKPGATTATKSKPKKR